jgi:mono/diheme cytochrome c family protein
MKAAALSIAVFAAATPVAAQDAAVEAPPGEAQFQELCGMCHRANGMGTGLLMRRLPPEQAQLEARDNLTADFVKVVVRRGVVNMPPLSKAEVSDEALEAIAAYLEAGPHAEEAAQ